jgi:hypothetical protein
MSFTPDMQAAREAFAKRVAAAYRTTWAGYGYVGPEFSEERAIELGKQMATNAFPYCVQPIIKLDLDKNTIKRIRELVLDQPTSIVRFEGDAPSGGYDLDDGVVGD